MATHTVEVIKVFGPRTDEPRPRERRASDAKLLRVKVLLLLAGVLASLSANGLRDAQATGSVTNEWQGHVLRYPKSWWVKKEGIHLATVVSELKSDHMQLAPALLPRPDGIQIRLERFALDVSEDKERLTLAASLDAAALARVAARHVGIDPGDPPRVRRTALMGQPAVEVSGPRADGWGAVIAMATGRAIILMQMAAPSRFDFERASATWRAMARSARPVPLRSYKALGEPAADPCDPGNGPGEEIPH